VQRRERAQAARVPRPLQDVLVAVGACAINGGCRRSATTLDVGEMLQTSTCSAPGVSAGSARPQRPRAAAAAGQGAPDPRGGARRLLPARLPAVGRRDLAVPDRLIAGRTPTCPPGCCATTDADVDHEPPPRHRRQGLRRVAIDPLSRVEGHGKVTILLDEHNRVQQVRLHIVEFRGFERFILGRPYWEVPVMVQRLCGICPVSHHLAASQGDGPGGRRRRSPADGDKLRRLMHYGQILQSHALHFFHLASPDLLFGFDSEAQAQHRRRGRGAPGHRAPGRAAAQVRPGGHPRHRRQAGARHRLGAGRREQAAHASPSATSWRRRCPRCWTWASAGGSGEASCTRRTGALYDGVRHAALVLLSLVGRRRDGPLRRRACACATPTARFARRRDATRTTRR
jgi:hypothetical protein